MGDQAQPTLADLAGKITERLSADVLLYNGGLTPGKDEEIIEACSKRRRRENVIIIITTSGGSPHVAYRIARALQANYKRVIAFVPGYCKSAGTLLTLGAHELVLADHADLGPLDVQLPAQEVGERSSGLTPTDALIMIEGKAIDAFEDAFKSMRGLQLSTAMAADKATEFATQLFAPLIGQIDPMKIAEVDRSNRIAYEYGRRLVEASGNADMRSVSKLVTGYPSHGFVIDRTEAKQLFKKIRPPTPEEMALAIRSPFSDDDAMSIFLNAELVEEKPDGQPKPESGESKPAGSPAGTASTERGDLSRSPQSPS